MWIPLHRTPSFVVFKKPKIETNANFLDEPKTKKLNCKNVTLNGLEIGHASMQGYRVNMEDEYIIDRMDSLPDHTLVGIMDGHAGKCSASFCSVELKSKIEETQQWKEYARLSESKRAQRTDLLSQALVQAYENIDKELELLDSGGLMDQSGCTAVSCIIAPTHVICANLGDSRCLIGSRRGTAATAGEVLSSKGVGVDESVITTISLTEDHKPSNPEEKERIEHAGGFVLDDRVNGELAMSRALGDFRYKNNSTLSREQYQVICYPDIAIYERSGNNDACMILACDGVWDVMSNAEAIAYLLDIVFVDNNIAALTLPSIKGSDKTSNINNNNNNNTSSNNNSNNTSSDDESSIDTLAVIPPTRLDSTKRSSLKTQQLTKLNHNDNNNDITDIVTTTTKKNTRKAVLHTTTTSACEAAGSLIDLAFADGSTDNISAVILKFL